MHISSLITALVLATCCSRIDAAIVPTHRDLVKSSPDPFVKPDPSDPLPPFLSKPIRLNEPKIPTTEQLAALGYKVKPDASIIPGKTMYAGYYDLGRLGSGAYGHVDLGYDGREYVAIKYLKQNTVTAQAVGENEMRIHYKLRHIKGVVKLLGRIKMGATQAIVMEAATDGTLTQYAESKFDKGNVTENYFSEGEAKRFIMELAYALKEIHAVDIAVRDIKPDNILLFRNKTDGLLHAKFSDFGLSTKNPEGPTMPPAVGSPWYMATETLLDQVYTLFKADIFGLGMTLYMTLNALLVGKVFTEAKDLVERQVMRRSAPSKAVYLTQFDFRHPRFTALEERFPEAGDLIRHMLDRDPVTRYSAVQVIAHPWFK